jgi:uncharacterized protein
MKPKTAIPTRLRFLPLLFWLAAAIAPSLCAGSVSPIIWGADMTKVRASAEAGDVQAQDTLGEAYYYHSEYATAVSWFRRAAEHGGANSQWRLGMMLLGGMTSIKKVMAVEKDPYQGLRWLFKGASQGDELAQLALGDCYAAGRFVATNRVEAFKWYARAAERGSLVLVGSRSTRSC